MNSLDFFVLITSLALATCHGQLNFSKSKQYAALNEAQVSVKVHGTHVCGGTLIDPTHILTASHCIDEFLKPYPMKTVPSMSVSAIRSGKRSNVATFTKIGLYKNLEKSISPNGIGIIELKDAIEVRSAHDFPELLDENVRLHSTFNVMVVGSEQAQRSLWHKTRSISEFKIQIVDQSKCRSHDSTTHASHLCAIVLSDVYDCQSLIGHPVVYDNKIFGIITNTFGKCKRGNPILFAKIHAFAPSIMETMKRTQECFEPTCYNVQETVDGLYDSEYDDNKLGLQKPIRSEIPMDIQNLRKPVNFWGPN